MPLWIRTFFFDSRVLLMQVPFCVHVTLPLTKDIAGFDYPRL